MENASKAIIMAGGILIALIILSALVILFSHMGSIYTAEGEVLTEKQLEEYNRRFNTYDRSLYGSELLSLANLISDYNYRLLMDQEDQEGQFYKENNIEVKVSFYTDIVGARDENNKWIYKTFKAKENQPLQKFKDYNDEIENKLATASGSEYDTLKSALTEIRSLPFICISDKTINDSKTKSILLNMYSEEELEKLKVEYNKFGRISKMHFVQVLDTDISGVIHR